MIDPVLVSARFSSWAASLDGDGPDLIALERTMLRCSGDSARDDKPLHLGLNLNQRLVLS